MGGGTLGVNCACTGRWNQFCGMPFVAPGLLPMQGNISRPYILHIRVCIYIYVCIYIDIHHINTYVQTYILYLPTYLLVCI